jgi:hypothetical protein
MMTKKKGQGVCVHAIKSIWQHAQSIIIRSTNESMWTRKQLLMHKVLVQLTKIDRFNNPKLSARNKKTTRIIIHTHTHTPIVSTWNSLQRRFECISWSARRHETCFVFFLAVHFVCFPWQNMKYFASFDKNALFTEKSWYLRCVVSIVGIMIVKGERREKKT